MVDKNLLSSNPFTRRKEPTARELAEQLGVSAGYLRSVFRGERNPGVKLARRIMQLPEFENLTWEDIYGQPGAKRGGQ